MMESAANAAHWASLINSRTCWECPGWPDLTPAVRCQLLEIELEYWEHEPTIPPRMRANRIQQCRELMRQNSN